MNKKNIIIISSVILIIGTCFTIGMYSKFIKNSFVDNSNFIYLGVLETKESSWGSTYQERRDAEEQGIQDTTEKKIARVMFYKAQDKWNTLEKDIANSELYPTDCFWYITFDGKLIGNFQSSFARLIYKDLSWTFPRDAYHVPESNNLPTVGEPTMDFAGWPGELHPRPLVIVSELYYNDPENWQSFSLKDEIVKKVIPSFKEYIASYDNKIEVDNSSIKYLEAYKSLSGKILTQVNFYQSQPDEWSGYPAWFYISPDGMLINLTDMIDSKYRGDNSDGFTEDDNSYAEIVDIGDYDSDGYSEFIFWVSRYNGDGYVLFYDDFKSSVSFEWRYH